MTPTLAYALEEDFFTYILQQQHIHFDQTQVHTIVQQIEQLRLQNGAQTDKIHKEYVKQKINNPTCPNCRSNMVKRVAKTGKNKGNEFWGCPKFPQCRGTRRIASQQVTEQQRLQKELENIVRNLF